MTEEQGIETPVDTVPDPPFLLTVALGVPTFFVVVWFMARIFGGRWIDPADP